jgi:hypothetical protein
MSIHKRYSLSRVQHPVLTLGGRWVRPRPIIAITLVGPLGTWLTEGHLDTGADDTIFPAVFASRVGVDLSHAPSGTATGVGLTGISLRYAEVIMRLAGNRERREWKAWVGFTATPLKRPLLGFAGFLQFFSAHFYGDREELELDVNSLYPGT